MNLPQVRVKLVDLGEKEDPNMRGVLNSGRYTDVFVTENGRTYYSRTPGWGADDAGYQLAQFRQQQRRYGVRA